MKNEANNQDIGNPMQESTATPSLPVRPDPEVSASKARRKFTAQYKLRILTEVDRCVEDGQIGAILRREGIYHSNISIWRKQRDQGVLAGLSIKRGRKSSDLNPLVGKVAHLEREIQRLMQKLKQAESIIEVQKKISELMGILQPQQRGSN
jgi:transposase-like protein